MILCRKVAMPWIYKKSNKKNIIQDGTRSKNRFS